MTSLDTLRGRLIASVQAYSGEPMRDARTMAQIARACQLGGAAAIRCQGIVDIAAIRQAVDVPVIGLWKDGHEGVYITPSIRHALACVNAGAEIVAVDATTRERPDAYADIVRAVHDAGALVMADCGSISDARHAAEAGSDILSTTLAGYTPDRPKTPGPDLELLSEMVGEFGELPVFCEGRLHTPADAAEAIRRGAWAAVVGTAITHPTSITGWFAAAVADAAGAARDAGADVGAAKDAGATASSAAGAADAATASSAAAQK